MGRWPESWEIRVLPLARPLIICVTYKTHFPQAPGYCKRYLDHLISQIPVEPSCLVGNSGLPSERNTCKFKGTGSDYMHNKIHSVN